MITYAHKFSGTVIYLATYLATYVQVHMYFGREGERERAEFTI